MPALVPSFLFDFESEMQVITELEFNRFNVSDANWWGDVTKVRKTGKKQEIIAWILSTMQIRDQGNGGNMFFDDMFTQSATYQVGHSGAGLKLTRDQVEDNDGDGFDFAAQWSQEAGALMSYWPQKQSAALLLSGETTAIAKAYDGLAYFAQAHPLNPFRPGVGTYSNLLTGGASGLYPGACPIDGSVTIDVALANVQKVIAYVASLKMPNGVDPRHLKPAFMLVPPSLTARAQQLTNRRDGTVIPQGAAGGAGSASVDAIISNWGLGKPVQVDEFATSTAADATSWYMVCEQVKNSQLGGLIYLDREPFKITYYTGQGGGTGVSVDLDRARELEWHLQGRNVAGYGHPYAIFKVKAA